jgi:uncharacterized protein YaaQ
VYDFFVCFILIYGASKTAFSLKLFSELPTFLLYKELILLKLIFAVVNGDDSQSVAKTLIKNGFFATKLASTGGFLSAGNTTFLICTEDAKVDVVIRLISEKSHKRSEVVQNSVPFLSTETFGSFPMEVQVGGATIFVTDIERFEKV